MTDSPLYRHLLDNLSTATLLAGADCRLHYLNPAAEALLEVSRARVINLPLESLFRRSAQEADNIAQATRQVLNNQHPITRRQAGLVLASGQAITADFAITPIDDDDSQAAVIEIFPLDRLLRISREEALVSSQQTTRLLIRGLAHEIKNPLGGIRGAAQLLDRELDQPGLHEYTRVIIEEADRLRNLVDRLLGPHKPGAPARLNIHEITEHIRRLLGAEAGDSILIERDYDPSIPEFDANREQLIQALLNIGRNALEALRRSPPEGERGRILLRTRVLRQFTIGQQRHPLVCRVDICDNGPGIDPELRERIFFPMVSGRPDGTGLGLSIAQSIVQQHQGLIACDSDGPHTRFSVYLPMETPHGH